MIDFDRMTNINVDHHRDYHMEQQTNAKYSNVFILLCVYIILYYQYICMYVSVS